MADRNFSCPLDIVICKFVIFYHFCDEYLIGIYGGHWNDTFPFYTLLHTMFFAEDTDKTRGPDSYL